MLAVGRALMARPRLLMLGKPTTGLAPIVAELAFEALAGLKQKGTTLLIAEQQVPLALSVADHEATCSTGRIRLEGASAELERNPEGASRVPGYHENGRPQRIVLGLAFGLSRAEWRWCTAGWAGS